MPRPGGISNFLRQLAGPRPRGNRMNRQPRNVNRESAPMQTQPNFREEGPLFGFGPEPGVNQGFNGYGIFGGTEPLMEPENLGVNDGENMPLENETRHIGYSIFD